MMPTAWFSLNGFRFGNMIVSPFLMRPSGEISGGNSGVFSAISCGQNTHPSSDFLIISSSSIRLSAPTLSGFSTCFTLLARCGFILHCSFVSGSNLYSIPFLITFRNSIFKILLSSPETRSDSRSGFFNNT